MTSDDNEIYCGNPDELVVEKTGTLTDEPPLYEVLLHNDDYTTMEFVVQLLMSVFHKTEEDATRIMLAIHKRGVGIAGIYPLELAESKKQQTLELAQEAGFPLQCTLQEVDI